MFSLRLQLLESCECQLLLFLKGKFVIVEKSVKMGPEFNLEEPQIYYYDFKSLDF